MGLEISEHEKSPEKQVLPTVLIDFGGVVVKNGFRDWVATIATTGAERAKYNETIDLADAGKISSDECLERLAALSNRTSAEVQQELISAFELNTTVLEAILKLKNRGHKIVLVSNFMKPMIDGLLNAHNLRGYFDRIFISSEMGVIKPSPEFFQAVLHSLRIKPEDALFIDDSRRNIETAQNEGVKQTIHLDEVVELPEKLRRTGIDLDD